MKDSQTVVTNALSPTMHWGSTMLYQLIRHGTYWPKKWDAQKANTVSRQKPEAVGSKSNNRYGIGFYCFSSIPIDVYVTCIIFPEYISNSQRNGNFHYCRRKIEVVLKIHCALYQIRSILPDLAENGIAPANKAISRCIVFVYKTYYIGYPNNELDLNYSIRLCLITSFLYWIPKGHKTGSCRVRWKNNSTNCIPIGGKYAPLLAGLLIQKHYVVIHKCLAVFRCISWLILDYIYHLLVEYISCSATIVDTTPFKRTFPQTTLNYSP